MRLGKWWCNVKQEVGEFHGPGGERLFVSAKVRPAWYWRLREAWLFVRIVWRIDMSGVGRMSWGTAWEICFHILGGHGLTRKDVRTGPQPKEWSDGRA